METIILTAISRNTIYTPLALLYIKGCVEREKALSRAARVELREFELDDSPEYILWDLVRDSPRIIAFSCYVWNIVMVLQLCRMIKQVLPGVVIVLGGPETASRGRELLEGNPAVDVVAGGEGEYVFPRIARHYITGGAGLADIRGITYRKGRAVAENPAQPPVARLDDLPSVYAAPRLPVENREVCLETQRGCVFGCGFCYYNKGSRSRRVFGMARVKRELEFLLAHRDLTIYLMDPVFNLDLKRAKEICRFIIAHNRHHVPFHTELQAELVDEELACLLKKADMRYVEVGLQSSDHEVLANVGRPFDREKFLRGYHWLKRSGLVVELQLILGLPGDSLERFERSLDFALELDPPVLSVFKLQVLPGTRIREQAGRLGLEYRHDPPYDFISSPTMGFGDVVRAQKMVNSVSLFRTDPKARELCRRRGMRMTGLIRLWLEHMPADGFLLNGEDNRALAKEARRFVRSLCPGRADAG